MTPTPWTKWRADLSSTRIQITYALTGAYLAILVKGLLVSTTTADIVALLNAAWPGLGLVLAQYFGGKVLEARQNGNGLSNGGH